MDNLLPADITTNILSRLPIESVFQCRQVCRTWRTLIHHPSLFAHKYILQLDDHNAGAGKVSFIFLTWVSNNRTKQLFYVEYDENDDQSYTKRTRINLQPPYNTHYIVGSCNGLICISVTHQQCISDPVYICNPITRECVNLPGFDERSCLRDYIVSGFGYHPSTNEYKVVRIYYSLKDQPLVGSVQVFTLGSDSGWRNKGEITYSFLFYHRSSPAILANEALYWLEDKGKIVAFDLNDEEFRLLPSPPCLLHGNTDKYCFQLRVLGGWLCVVHYNYDGSADVWSLKNNNGCYDFWSWSKEFTIEQGGLFTEEYEPLRFSQPFALTKQGEVLFYDHNILSRYDLKTATFEKLMGFDRYFQEAIPHTNSFVSLKVLGEEDRKIIGSVEAALESESIG